ncbi:N-acetylmuramoyl-L-alanine amidase [Burkholderia gladioli]|uniref:N-acetylmuramoyl-L-alanine amidase n=1 Tax=Burkholderia gladioli TaxID=28095 RepID=A0AB38TWG4_BURGA|nr:N-acetylmuramoyl-L-alanine amidase [Burkholderia gladioli]MCA8171218.1 N-acetylmuramoyl-L-alanine amidase [Burkholderia gladioli]MDN7717862.1 N-acetylmuramoyl-L-alanine amidase [Burkholderia gladioli]UWX71774.1 N-acetylmuramoyl-L-alanine amidase [Burkholderia gladioli]
MMKSPAPIATVARLARVAGAPAAFASRVLVFGCAAALLAACASPTLVDRDGYVADTSHPARGTDSRVRFLVLHYTESDDQRALFVLTHNEVSAHYLVPSHPPRRNGEPVVLQLVPENQRAWHAGVSDWQGTTELNAASIGIEIVNAGPLDAPANRHWQPYAPDQIEAVVKLAKDIVTRYGIPPTRVVAHSDIAPQRKIDPGPAFPWQALARAGIGAWPDDATVAARLAGRAPGDPVDVRGLQLKLARYGYEVATDGVLDARTRRVFAAFQMHFRPADYSGNPDAQTDAIAQALLDKYFPGAAPSAGITPPASAPASAPAGVEPEAP